MPVLINEVIIRMVVDGSDKEDASANSCGPPGNTDGSASTTSGETTLAEQLLEIIKEKQER